MNVFVHELKQNWRALSLWCLGMLFLVGATIAKTMGLAQNGGISMQVMIASMPKAVQSLFGLGVVDMGRPIGILAIVQLYIALIAVFQAVGLGTAAFAKEERDRTFDFLYVRGRTRTKILLAKALADVLMMAALSAFTWGCGALIVRAMMDQDVAFPFLRIMLSTFVLQLVFYALGLLASLLTRKMRLAGSIASGIAMGLFLLSILSAVGEWPGWIAALSPFVSFDGKRVLTSGLSGIDTLVWLGLAAAMTALAFYLHRIRDLHT